jgi:hypothetical protein
VQRIYPTRSDSLNVTLFARGGPAEVISLKSWKMHATQ